MYKKFKAGLGDDVITWKDEFLWLLQPRALLPLYSFSENWPHTQSSSWICSWLSFLLNLGNHQDNLEFGFPHTALDPFSIAFHSWISNECWKVYEGKKSRPSAGSPTFHKLNEGEGSKVEVPRTKMSHILTMSEIRRSELTNRRAIRHMLLQAFTDDKAFNFTRLFWYLYWTLSGTFSDSEALALTFCFFF